MQIIIRGVLFRDGGSVFEPSGRDALPLVWRRHRKWLLRPIDGEPVRGVGEKDKAGV